MQTNHLNIQLHQFEGPMSLLLYLIRKEEMNIMDININEITTQYFDYIKLMKELDLDVAGEFIAMAATLIQIKSRMLLPQYDENGEIVESEDPRKELIQKLLEYQKYQEAAKLLLERPWLGRDFFARGQTTDFTPEEEGIELEDNALFGLITSYRKVLKTAKKRVHQVASKVQSIAQRILEIRPFMKMGERTSLFFLLNSTLMQTENRARQLLITFLSLLELGKLGFVSMYQTEAYSDIYLDLKKDLEIDVITRVEEYDNVYSEDVASKMFEQKPAANTNTDGGGSVEQDEFVLTDAEDDQQLGFAELEDLDAEEMVTDEELLAAEQELLNSTEDNVEDNVEDGEENV
ncbi:MAG: segregation and condensation protein A [Pseudobdellovibrionaceae bacterium]